MTLCWALSITRLGAFLYVDWFHHYPLFTAIELIFEPCSYAASPSPFELICE